MKYKILCPKCKKGMTCAEDSLTDDYTFRYVLICYKDGIKIYSNYPITDGKLPELKILS